MDCVFCRKKLANFATLQKTEPGLQLLSLAVEQGHAGHAEMLDALGVRGARYTYGDDSPEALAYAVDPTWRGELPRTVFFDGRGERTALSGMVDDETALELVAYRRSNSDLQK
jgi:hypothetical protein